MTNHLHQAIRLAGRVLLLALGLVLLPVALPSAAAVASAMAAPGADVPAADLSGVALTGDPRTLDDALAEGADVLTLDADSTPPALWSALIEAGHHGVAGDGCDCLYVPVGTAVRVPGGLYLATIDGWFHCADGVTVHGDCSATGPVVPAFAGWQTFSTAELDTVPTDAQPALTSAQRARYGTDEYGPCGTDAQCAAYAREVLHEEPTGYAT